MVINFNNKEFTLYLHAFKIQHYLSTVTKMYNKVYELYKLY